MSFLNPFRTAVSSSRMGNSQSQESNVNPPPHQTGDSSEDDLWIGSPAHRTSRPAGRAVIDLISSSAPLPSTSQTLSTVQETPVQTNDTEVDDLWVSPHKSLKNTPAAWSLSKILSGKKIRAGASREHEDEVWQSFVDARGVGEADHQDVGGGLLNIGEDEDEMIATPTGRGKRGRAIERPRRSADSDGSPTPPAKQQNKRRKVVHQAHQPGKEREHLFAVPARPSSLSNETALPTPPISESPALIRSRKRKIKDNLRPSGAENTAEKSGISRSERESTTPRPPPANEHHDESTSDWGAQQEPQSDAHFYVDIPQLEQNSIAQPELKFRGTSSIGGSTLQQAKAAMGEVQEDLKDAGPFTNYEIRLMDCFMDSYCADNEIRREKLNDLIQNKQRGDPDLQQLWEEIYEVLPQRHKDSVRKFCRRRFHNYEKRGKWSTEDDEELKQAYASKPNKWTEIGEIVGRMPEDCRDRWRNYLQSGHREKKGEWSSREELDLSYAVSEVVDELKEAARENAAKNGQPIPDRTERDWERMINWSVVSHKMRNGRSRIQCLQHWQAMERRESSLSRPSLSCTDTPGRLSAAPPSSANWRHKAAERTYDKMLVGDKIQILLQIQDCEAISEENIPWVKLTENGDSKWNTMGRRLAFENMKTLLSPKQLRKPLREVVSDLIDYFEREHSAELSDFYVSPAPKMSPGSRRRKRNGRYMALDADDNEDDSLQPEELSPRTKRRKKQRKQSSTTPQSSNDDSVKGTQDERGPAQYVTQPIGMSEEIGSSEHEQAGPPHEAKETGVPPVPYSNVRTYVIEETEGDDDSSEESLDDSSPPYQTKRREQQPSNSVARVPVETEPSMMSTPAKDESSNGDQPEPARFIASASEMSDEESSSSSEESVKSENETGSTSESASQSEDSEEAGHRDQNQSDTESEAASHRNASTPNHVETGADSSSGAESLETSGLPAGSESASTRSESGPDSEDTDHSAVEPELPSEPRSGSSVESQMDSPVAKAESASESEPGSDSSVSSEDSSESSSGELEPAAKAETTRSISINEAPRLDSKTQHNEYSDSDLASNWPYDSPHKPNDAEALQKADEEALANFEKGFSWDHIHDVWESRTQQGLSPELFGDRLDAFRKERAPKSQTRKRIAAHAKIVIKSTTPDSDTSAEEADDDEEEDDEDSGDQSSDAEKTSESSTSSRSSSSNDASDSNKNDKQSRSGSGSSSSISESSGEEDSSSSAASASPAAQRGAMSSDEESEDEESSG